ncbi:MAG: ribonuclease P Rpr2/Rpp21/SNM1 subunit [Candidatus Parvarchaeota archaeon]|nr:ribonuclease P Rpr2/Rpp21/SNM1 subunit [Candidatus Parvarchaeota archaeon]
MLRKKNKSSFEKDYNFLVKEALRLYDTNRELSNRYAYIAYRIYLSKKINVSRDRKLLICRRCNRILIPGRTAVVRLKNKSVTYKCLNCGNVRKVKYDKSKRR